MDNATIYIYKYVYQMNELVNRLQCQYYLKYMQNSRYQAQGQPPISHSMHIFHKINEQIQQQTQSILSNINQQETSAYKQSTINTNTQSNNKSIQKYVMQTKNVILKILGSRMAQIVGIEEKYKSVVVEMSRELEAVQQREKEVFVKFQGKVLDCDRYKMETVHADELYRLVSIQNGQLKIQIAQLKKSIANLSAAQSKAPSQQSSTQSNQHVHIIPTPQFTAITLQLQQHRQQRSLYHTQLAALNQQLEESKHNEAVANQRILNLMRENQQKDDVIREVHENVEMLKEEIGNLVGEIEEQKGRYEQLQTMSNRDMERVEERQFEERSKIEKTIKEKQKIIQILQGTQKEHKLMLTVQQQKLSEQSQKIHHQQSTISQQASQLQTYQSSQQSLTKTLMELQSQMPNLAQITRNQLLLQQNYGKKQALLSKQVKEQGDKIKFYKQQNQRLYEAMQQFANKQSKLTKQLKNMQQKYNSIQDSQIRITASKVKLMEVIRRTHQEIKQFKVNDDDRQKYIKSEIEGYRSIVKDAIDACSINFVLKIKEHDEIWNNKCLRFQQQLTKKERQVRELQQKITDSQLNSNRINNALIESKAQIGAQLNEKIKIIHALETELRQQKQLNQSCTRKISEAVHKFYQIPNNSTSHLSYNTKLHKNQNHRTGKDYMLESGQTEITRKLVEQKSRLAVVQKQYEAIVQNH